MNFTDALAAALHLLATRDPHVVAAVIVSLEVALLATLFATLLGAPLGFLVGAGRFRARRAVEVALNTATALPTVVVGLLVYTLLSRRGPLGGLELLYTRGAMVIGETLLVTPLMAALTMALVSGADPRIRETALTLGATRLGAARAVLSELRRGALAAVATGFGRLISELGVALMVGGNIESSTRTMTTAIALETGKGEFALALALGVILLGVALLVNVSAAAVTGSR
ncbi:MAG TPA: ABC transporter permease [Candidatus Dormibacteraeota bacterium]|nr:ABC transporter permease [Candidatus Dormibacteraeota bacterium]